MSELIDRDELFLQIERARFDVNYNIRTNLGMRCFLTEVKYALKCFVAKAPTVEERKHGHWKKSEFPSEKYCCSVCGAGCWYYDYEGDVARSRYCPQCGARMDEVTEND